VDAIFGRGEREENKREGEKEERRSALILDIRASFRALLSSDRMKWKASKLKLTRCKP